MSNQVPIKIVSSDHLDKSITLLVGNRRIEFLLKDYKYETICSYASTWQENGWTNYLLAKVVEGSHAIYIEGKRASRQQEKEIKTMVDFRKLPSEEFSFTVIATEARSVTYNSGRKWFKTVDDAKTFAGEVFELEKNERKSAFDLAIVQCVDVVRPKPQIELVSSFKKTAESSE
jgi:hypothetical protein